MTRQGNLSTHVSGIYRSHATLAGGGGVSVLMPLQAAQLAWKIPKRVDSIHIVLERNSDPTDVENAIAATLPKGLQLRPPPTKSPFAEETSLSVRHGMVTARVFLLLIATLVISNVYLISVTERQRQFGIMRTIGASRRQVASCITVEAFILGIAGAILGCIAGALGAEVLATSMEGLYQTDLPGSDIGIGVVMAAMLFGIILSIGSASVAIRQAYHMSPIQTMQRASHSAQAPNTRLRTIGAFVLIAVSSVVLATSIVGWVPIEISAWAGVCILLGLVILLQNVIHAISIAAAALLRPLYGHTIPWLARRQLLRHRLRTSLTVGVLFVAIATGVGLAGSVIESVNDVRGWYRNTMVADFFIRAMSPDMASGQAADLPDTLGNEISAIQGIESVETVRFVRGRVADRSVIIIAHDFDRAAMVQFDLVQGDWTALPEELEHGEVVIGSVLAKRAGDLSVGDKVDLETDSGKVSLTVAAIANDYMAGGLTMYMKRSFAERYLNVSGVDAYMVRAKDDARDHVKQELSSIVGNYGLMLQSSDDLQREVDGMMNGVIAGLWALILIGFVVGAAGIANTVAINILEQRMELVVLRVVGASLKQTRRIVASQALIMGLTALVPGVLSGALIGYLISLTRYTVSGHAVNFAFHPMLMIGTLLAGLIMIYAVASVSAIRATRSLLNRRS
ncbi:MAG: FtsX-like permease family protein [Planctomycetales bacterium]|nr:FtsX-like permease family protein [Planctomycetales bacterium]